MLWRTDFMMESVSTQIRKFERAALPQILAEGKRPQLLMDLYRKRAELAKSLKESRSLSDTSAPPSFPKDWTTDPRQLLARIRTIREGIPIVTKPFMEPPFDTSTCPRQSLNLSIASDKHDLPTVTASDPSWIGGNLSGAFTMAAPWDSQTIYFVNSVDDWGSGESLWSYGSSMSMSTYLAFPFVTDPQWGCPKFSNVLWSVEISASVKFDLVNCDLSQVQLRVGFVGTDPNLSRPVGVSDFFTFRLLEYGISESWGGLVWDAPSGVVNAATVTGRLVLSAIWPISSVQAANGVSLVLITDTAALNGSLRTSGQFEIRPDPALTTGWGVSYVLF